MAAEYMHLAFIVLIILSITEPIIMVLFEALSDTYKPKIFYFLARFFRYLFYVILALLGVWLILSLYIPGAWEHPMFDLAPRYINY